MNAFDMKVDELLAERLILKRMLANAKLLPNDLHYKEKLIERIEVQIAFIKVYLNCCY